MIKLAAVILNVALSAVPTTAGSESASALRLPSIISDHMVIQRDTPFHVWGWARPGERIDIYAYHQHARTFANADGEWSVMLASLPAGGPYELRVIGRNKTILVEDVLAGEVWICSGQSNMQWSVARSENAEWEIQRAKYSEMRFFTVPQVVGAEPQEDVDDGYWEICSPDTVGAFSAVGYFFGRSLFWGLNSPIGLIDASWGGTPAESWTPLPALESHPELRPIVERWNHVRENYDELLEQYAIDLENWEEAVRQAEEAGEKPPPPLPDAPWGPEHPWKPSGLYNAMIAPLTNYEIRGVIWYQGEANVLRAHQYRTLFPTMIREWREAWDEYLMPFYYVQLANFMEPVHQPTDSRWAELRDAQRRTLYLPATGMAVAIDIGDAEDIHPKNKQEVGRRLAAWALADTYGQDIPHSGPIYDRMRVVGNEVRLSFDHTDGGLQALGDYLWGFTIAGDDRTFYTARATIDGDQVVVWSEKVPEPVAVRYGWANNPYGNLYNGAGLPATPFRTDDWPGLTFEER